MVNKCHITALSCRLSSLHMLSGMWIQKVLEMFSQNKRPVPVLFDSESGILAICAPMGRFPQDRAELGKHEPASVTARLN